MRNHSDTFNIEETRKIVVDATFCKECGAEKGEMCRGIWRPTKNQFRLRVTPHLSRYGQFKKMDNK